EDKANRYYLYMLLNSPEFRREVSLRATGTSSSMKNISQAKYLDIELILPPLHIQNHFAELVKVVRNNIGINQKTSSNSLTELRNSLTSKSFTGQVTETWR